MVVQIQDFTLPGKTNPDHCTDSGRDSDRPERILLRTAVALSVALGAGGA